MHNTTVVESCSDRHWRRNSSQGVFISYQMSFGISRTAFIFVLEKDLRQKYIVQNI